jgi:hypothetical protein
MSKRHHGLHLTAATVLLAGGVVHAQQPSVAERVRAALDVVRIADSVHKRGVPERDISVIFDEVRRKSIPATETRDVLQATDASLKEHGPVDNFGAFVQSQLAAGKRGRALSQAIRAEHARRGIGGGQQRNTKSRSASDSARATSGKATATRSSRGPASASAKAKAAVDEAKAKAKTKSKGGRP